MEKPSIKNQISAYLEDTSILTKNEVNDLLVQCFAHLNHQDKQKKEFDKTYKELMKTSKQKEKEVKAALNDVEDFVKIIKNLT